MSSIHLRKARAVRLLLLAFAAAAVSGCNPTQAQGGPGGPPPVSVAPAVQRSLQNSEEFSARIEAQATVELRSRVAGTVERVHFKEGQRVAKGALLFTIDPKPFEAEVARLHRHNSRARTHARPIWRSAELVPVRRSCCPCRRCRLQEDGPAARRRTPGAKPAVKSAGAIGARTSAQLSNLGYARITAPVAGRISRAAT